MRLYYTAETNIENLNITAIGFLPAKPSMKAFEYVSISGESCEASATKNEDGKIIVDGRWKGEIDAVIDDDSAVYVETVADIVSQLNGTELKMIECGDDAEGYVQFTKLRIEGLDGEEYTFPTSQINTTIIVNP